jgi:site-specific recombinase XerD
VSVVKSEIDGEEWLLVTEKAKEKLDDKTELLVESEHERFVEWCLEKGKHPRDNVGLGRTTVENYLRRLDRIKRRIWEENGEYTKITPELADEYIDRLKRDKITKNDYSPYGETSKRKQANTLEKYFQWKEEDWECEVRFREYSGQSKDALADDEREPIRKASRKYRDLKSYSNVTPEERDRIKGLIAQRLGKSKEEVTKEDWESERKKSWEITSLIYTSLDIAPRPKLIGRMKVDWVNLDKRTIRIPREDAVKNEDYWEASITQDTATILGKWIEEREALPKYDDTGLLWLTREGTPYSSGPLSRLLRDLCEEAGIDTETRDISWYSIRHNVGEQMTSKGGIEEAQVQLRHNSVESTMNYTNATPEERRDTLGEMG